MGGRLNASGDLLVDLIKGCRILLWYTSHEYCNALGDVVHGDKDVVALKDRLELALILISEMPDILTIGRSELPPKVNVTDASADIPK